MTNRMRSCKDCSDRVVGCHIDCERYKADTAANEAVKAEKKKQMILDKESYEHAQRARAGYKRDAKRRRGY